MRKDNKQPQPTVGQKILARNEKLIYSITTPKKICGYVRINVANQIRNYAVIVSLFTNVTCKFDEIPTYADALVKLFRTIINADCRYQQRQDNLPPFRGHRAIAIKQIAKNTVEVYIKFGVTNSDVAEYIIRQWCRRTNQLPHRLQIIFDSTQAARRAFGSSYNTDYHENEYAEKSRNTIVEEYYFSTPARIAYYMNKKGATQIKFGAVANIDLQANKYPSFADDDIYLIENRRVIQKFGAERQSQKTAAEKIIKERHLPPHCTDSQAKIYYRQCKTAGDGWRFNPYIYARLKNR